jgi:hypothetical protein
MPPVIHLLTGSPFLQTLFSGWWSLAMLEKDRAWGSDAVDDLLRGEFQRL